DHHAMEHVHESPPVMLVPLFVLSAGAVVAGFALQPWFLGEGRDAFWNGSIFNGPLNHGAALLEQVPIWVHTLPSIVGLLGIATAYVMYMAFPLLPMRLATMFRGIYLLLLNKWYFDELYDAIFVQPLI